MPNSDEKHFRKIMKHLDSIHTILSLVSDSHYSEELWVSLEDASEEVDRLITKVKTDQEDPFQELKLIDLSGELEK